MNPFSQPVLGRFALFVSLFCLAGAVARATPPTLTDKTSSPPGEVRPGEAVPFQALYKQDEGDPPKSVFLVVQTPDGETVRIPSHSIGDPRTGISESWNYAPREFGNYRYHFEATSSTGASTREPQDAGQDSGFVSVNLVNKYIILAVGLLVALVFLPFVVYAAARGINKRGDPAAAARIALLIGVLASYALFWYLFFSVYHALGAAIGAIAALGILVVLFTRR